MGVKQILKKARKQKRKILTVSEALEVIKSYKIPVAESKLVKKVEDALEFADKIGYPVVLKVVSAKAIHKTDVGGIALDVKNKEELEKSYKKIIDNVKKKVRAKVDGILIQKMVKGGEEVIVGGKKDPQFGQTLMFGLGGIFTEVYDDVSFRVIPINKKDAEEMIQEIKGYKILKGYRNKKYDVNSLIDILLKTSELLEENQEIVELDINPVIVLQKGAVAVDARIVVD
jgi:acetyl-CoA synthetase (ADP-forming)